MKIDEESKRILEQEHCYDCEFESDCTRAKKYNTIICDRWVKRKTPLERLAGRLNNEDNKSI